MPSTMDAPDKLVLDLPGGVRQEFTLSKSSVTIGRASTTDIVLRDAKVSRCHARVERTSEGFEVVDLGSVNGVRVNGIAVARALLAPGDVLGIGETTLQFVAEGHETDLEMTRIDTIEDLKATLPGMPLSVLLEDATVPRLAIHTDTATWEIEVNDRVTVGRAADNDIVLDSPAVSRHHAVLERHGDTFLLRDLNSGNGTWLRNLRVTRVALADSDTFQVGPARLVFKRGETDDEQTMIRPLAVSPGGRRRVVVIPGFGGSTLWRGSEQVWPSARMLLNNADLLDMDEPLEARELVDEVVIIPNLLRQEQYSSLTDYLEETLAYEKGHDLLEFAYDFRQDNRLSARRLAGAIDAWKGSGPITIIAHSMGCLIARYYVERLGGHRHVERIIYLGAPHSGTPYAFASLMRGPGLLPLGLMNARLREVLATYPSWYQILPTYPCVSDRQSGLEVLDEESWVLEPNRPLLRMAREFRRELGTGSSVPSVCVFGYGIRTITSATVERNGSGSCQNADFAFSLKGDGMIPEDSAILPGAEIHPVKQRHGALYGNMDVKMRLKLELTR
jgi:pSer/pThr/pTyr-binding forkhead associated (FHA) protein